MRLMAKRVCWLLIEVARQDAECLQPPGASGRRSGHYFLKFTIPLRILENVE